MKLYNKVLIALGITAMTAAAAQAAADSPLPEPAKGTVHTKDNVTIAYDHYKNGFNSVIIVCPGFYNSKDNRWMKKTAEMLLSAYDVIAFDLRGHGSSGGTFMWAGREDSDVNAIIDYAKGLGYKHIGILAYSLGASASINAVAARDTVASMVLISCPSRFEAIDFCFWEPGMFSDLFDNIACGWQGKGARCGNMFLAKERPIDSIVRIKDTPILFIHGDRDWIVKPRHSKKLYDAAICPKKIEIVKGGFHAERLIQLHYEEMKQLILAWFAETLK
jgi:pimeloyl-ACP methyl ester carboxylesterase